MKVKGRVTELVGLVAKAVIPNVKVGELCLIDAAGGRGKIKAEVSGPVGIVRAVAQTSARRAEGCSR